MLERSEPNSSFGFVLPMSFTLLRPLLRSSTTPQPPPPPLLLICVFLFFQTHYRHIVHKPSSSL